MSGLDGVSFNKAIDEITGGTDGVQLSAKNIKKLSSSQRKLIKKIISGEPGRITPNQLDGIKSRLKGNTSAYESGTLAKNLRFLGLRGLGSTTLCSQLKGKAEKNISTLAKKDIDEMDLGELDSHIAELKGAMATLKNIVKDKSSDLVLTNAELRLTLAKNRVTEKAEENVSNLANKDIDEMDLGELDSHIAELEGAMATLKNIVKDTSSDLVLTNAELRLTLAKDRVTDETKKFLKDLPKAPTDDDAIGTKNATYMGKIADLAWNLSGKTESGAQHAALQTIGEKATSALDTMTEISIDNLVPEKLFDYILHLNSAISSAKRIDHSIDTGEAATKLNEALAALAKLDISKMDTDQLLQHGERIYKAFRHIELYPGSVKHYDEKVIKDKETQEIIEDKGYSLHCKIDDGENIQNDIKAKLNEILKHLRDGGNLGSDNLQDVTKLTWLVKDIYAEKYQKSSPSYGHVPSRVARRIRQCLDRCQ